MEIDQRFWNGKKWDGHRAFNTVNHQHVSCYLPAPQQDSCDIMIVECADGRWYVEDNWGTDAKGAARVWNPIDPLAGEPHFFDSENEAMQHAVAVVAKVSGVPGSGVSSI